MLKLMKYEFKRLMGLKTVMLGIFAVLECILLIFTFAESLRTVVVIWVVMFLMIGLLLVLIGIEAIVSYNRDLSRKSGYMTFLVPKSEFAILGSKITTAVVDLIMGYAFGMAILALNYFIIVGKFSSIETAIGIIGEMYEGIFHSNIDVGSIILSSLIEVVKFMVIVTIGFLAITLTHTILNQKRGKNIVAFIMFIAIDIAFEYIKSLVCGNFGYSITVGDQNIGMMHTGSYTLVEVMVDFVFGVCCFLASGFMLKKKLSL